MNPRRLWALLRREATEIRRDPFRLLAAFVVPNLLIVMFGFGITLDVENLSFAVLDHDRTPQSRAYTDNFAHSR